MTRTTLAACGAYALVTTVLSAQSPPPQPAPGQPGSVAGQMMSLTGCLKPWDPSTMDTTGGGASGTAGTRGATMPGVSSPGGGTAAAAPRFVLTGTEHAPATGAAATTPQGAPSPPTSPSPTLGAHGTFVLEPQSPSVDFAPFVNQQVRVTGTMLAEGAAAAARGTAGGAVAGTETGTGMTATTRPTVIGATPTTSPAGTPTASGTPTTGGTPTSTMGAKAGAAAARVSFTVTSITMVAKTCSK